MYVHAVRSQRATFEVDADLVLARCVGNHHEAADGPCAITFLVSRLAPPFGMSRHAMWQHVWMCHLAGCPGVCQIAASISKRCTRVPGQVRGAAWPRLQLHQGLVARHLLGQHQRQLLPDHLRMLSICVLFSSMASEPKGIGPGPVCSWACKTATFQRLRTST